MLGRFNRIFPLRKFDTRAKVETWQIWRMSREGTSPDKEMFNPLRRQKDTVKRCHRATFSGDSSVRPVSAILGKTDIWKFQILTTICLINTKY